MTPRILLIEDDVTTLALLDAYLVASGYRVDSVDCASNALAKMSNQTYEMILLDLNLPDEDGIVVARKIRSFSSVPIIMLTNRGGVKDRIAGLETGADDYVVKPFDPKELLARIKNTISRATGSVIVGKLDPDSNVTIGNRHFSLEKACLYNEENDIIDLTLGEYRVLSALVKVNGRVLSREYLLDAISQDLDEPYYRTVDVLIYRLRRKIEQNPKKPQFIKTVKGLGYRLML
ncbi:MAG: response regulator transcription factor [Firmicutes bacterium]|nr:response regulator transcription factor [Bacillota bacterium]